MAKYKVKNTTILHDGVSRGEGSIIELTDLQDCYKDNAGEKYNEEDFLKKVLDIGPCSFDTLKKYILD